MNDLKKPKRLPGLFNLYRWFVRHWLFFFDPETAHNITAKLADFIWGFSFGRSLTKTIYTIGLKDRPAQIGSLRIPNPVGLAAGFDKNARLLPGLENLGFGFIEIGTVTPRPQIGNARPRIFRESKRRALINKMGFPNDGADIIAQRLRLVKAEVSVPVGVNIGKNRDTPNSEAIRDYEYLVRKFAQIADYFVVNVSSPNTSQLRELQSVEFFKALSKKIEPLKITKPILLKLAPDLPHEDLKDICELCAEKSVFTGLVLTNTQPTDLGGISGWPLKDASHLMLKKARSFLPRNIPIISVGGIETAADAQARLDDGATAVQLYTSLIFQGPSVVRRILKKLR